MRYLNFFLAVIFQLLKILELIFLISLKSISSKKQKLNMQIEQALTKYIQLDIIYLKPNKKNIFQNKDNQDIKYNTLFKKSSKASSETIKDKEDYIKNFNKGFDLKLDKKNYNECKIFLENVKIKEDYTENENLYDKLNLSFDNYQQPINIEINDYNNKVDKNYEANNIETKKFREMSVEPLVSFFSSQTVLSYHGQESQNYNVNDLNHIDENIINNGNFWFEEEKIDQENDILEDNNEEKDIEEEKIEDSKIDQKDDIIEHNNKEKDIKEEKIEDFDHNCRNNDENNVNNNSINDINSHIYRNNEHPQQEILYFHEIEEIDDNNINNFRYFYLESAESIQNDLNINHDTNAQKTTEENMNNVLQENPNFNQEILIMDSDYSTFVGINSDIYGNIEESFLNAIVFSYNEQEDANVFFPYNVQ